MPPKKRPAPSSASGRLAKRTPTLSEIGTPSSMSDDELPDDDDTSKAIHSLVSKFSLPDDEFDGIEYKPDMLSGIFGSRDYKDLRLKKDHMNRPLWIDNRGKIIVESFSEHFQKAEAFLINIAEPQSRVSRIHEYSLTPHSLLAAVSVGLTTEDIIRELEVYSKTPLSSRIIRFIRETTKSFGHVRMVLKATRRYIESQDPEVLQRLLKDPQIAKNRVDPGQEIVQEAAPKLGQMVIPGTKMAAAARQLADKPQQLQQQPENEDDILASLRAEDEDEDEEIEQVHTFEIKKESVQEVAKRCLELNLPLTEEYDFQNDFVNANLDIDLKPSTTIRYYQETALSKMFGNGRARSGIIVLPCGAGKTLVGITAACTIKKGVIVLCTSAMSVVQWRAEFIKWSNVRPEDVACFTADNKAKFPGATGVLITTYSMVTQSRGRSYDSQQIMDFIMSREWGLMLLDEVHVVPADMFKKVTQVIAAHSKLGLTATLLREDDKIKDLNFIIGPKLYEANWQELSEQGHIAKVQCAEVWCPMTPEFYAEYLDQTGRRQDSNGHNLRHLLCVMNPRKFQYCQYLIDFHEKRGDKVIVFSDNVKALEVYAKKLNKVYIYGGTSQPERQTILENFRHNENINTLFLSKIGDTSLDLPEATCLIQISSHYGSRRQEAQRLGRVLRAKRRDQDGFNAYFYSLVSKDTVEMLYSGRRQAFLVDQGYAFKVITDFEGKEQSHPGIAFKDRDEQLELLKAIKKDYEEKKDNTDDLFDRRGEYKRKKKMARRMAGELSEMSGGHTMAYMEYNKSRNKELTARRRPGDDNKFIKGLIRKVEKQQKAKRDMRNQN